MEYKEYIITYKVGEEIKTSIEMGSHAKDAWETFHKVEKEAELVDIRKI